MPDFLVQLTGSPALANVPWVDPPSATRPSRIINQNDRTYRRINAIVGTTLFVSAIVEGYTTVQPDSVVGLFTMWAIEVPSFNGMPLQRIPILNTSSFQSFELSRIGHYTIVVRHENAGGFVVLHIESISQ